VARDMHTRTASTALPAVAGRRRGAGVRAIPGRFPSHADLPREQVTEIQRSRLLMGAVGAIEEYGYARTTVAHITARARVSRRTFYELFDDREACLAALVGDVIALVEGELLEAGLDGLPWRERVRGGLMAILSFFDREQALARVCVVEALRGGQSMLECREEVLGRLADVLDEGHKEGPRAGECTSLTAEGLVGAAFGIVHTRLLRGDREPLTGLVGELMAMIVLPYLGPVVARSEQTRRIPQAVARAPRKPPVFAPAQADPLQGLPMRLTYRTARVLECISRQPGVSNRQVADLAGIQDPGQISKLLARLQRLGLAENGGDGHLKGAPNAWTLTPLGRQFAQQLSMSAIRRNEAA
jgi:AcrR family transcriptional regulator